MNRSQPARHPTTVAGRLKATLWLFAWPIVGAIAIACVLFTLGAGWTEKDKLLWRLQRYRTSIGKSSFFRCYDSDAEQVVKLANQLLMTTGGRVNSIWIGPDIGDAGLKSILRLDGIQNVTRLDIGSPLISNESCRELERCSQLKHLQFDSAARIDCRGVEAISRIRSLESLIFISGPISDDCLHYLLDMPHLSDVGFDETLVTDAGIAAFTKSRPSVNIWTFPRKK